jgi:hypothetical protein
LHGINRNDGSLVARGCGHGDGEDDDLGVMPERVMMMMVMRRSLCQQLTADRHRHLCMMVMVLIVVMSAWSINFVVVVRARRVMVVAVVRCG